MVTHSGSRFTIYLIPLSHDYTKLTNDHVHQPTRMLKKQQQK